MVITISREFGSGGREIGKRLADALGLAYYDSEIITMIAKETGMSEEYIKNISEKGVYPYTFHFISLSSDTIFLSLNIKCHLWVYHKNQKMIKKLITWIFAAYFIENAAKRDIKPQKAFNMPYQLFSSKVLGTPL